jgi:hypothetical protein
MERSGDLSQRLAAWICRPRKGTDEEPLYKEVRAPGTVLVVEREKAGEAEVECQVPDGCTCIDWKLGRTGLFGFLQEDKNADGALLLCRPDGSFEARIIECKRTVDQRKWSDILAQLRWSLSKLLAIAGVLDIEIRAATLGTAYRNDKLSEEESPNPTLGKPLLDGGAMLGPEETEITAARLQQLAWMSDEVRLPGFARPFRHVKIRLDEATGRATHRLP